MSVLRKQKAMPVHLNFRIECPLSCIVKSKALCMSGANKGRQLELLSSGLVGLLVGSCPSPLAGKQYQ